MAPLMIVAVGLSTVTIGCSSNGAPVSESPSSSTTVVSTTTADQASIDAPIVPPGFDTLVTADGRTRTYRVVDQSVGGSAPLLFVLHGFGGTAEGMRSYARVEDAVKSVLSDGAVIVYPNGTGDESGLPQSWNAGGCCPFSIYGPVDDVSFFDQLITKLLEAYEIDSRRIWVVGHSNGGMMAYRLACELSSRVTAIGVAAGAMMIESCTPSRPVSAIHLHGGMDNVVPLEGGEIAGIVFPSARESFERFAGANSCTISDGVAQCPAGASVSLQTVDDWTHDWQPEWTTALIDFLSGQVVD